MDRKQRWTLIYHRYIGYGSYIIEFKRAICCARDLQSRKYTRDCLHFIIEGWPPVAFPDGGAWDESGTVAVYKG